jgi:subtilisin family serine protease
MKTTITFLIASIVCLYVNAQSDYYWYKGNKVPLNKIHNKKFLLIDQVQKVDNLKELLKVDKVKIEKYDKVYLSQNIKLNDKNKHDIMQWAVISDSLIINKNFEDLKIIAYESDFYETNNGIKAGLSHLFYVKLKDEKDTTILKKLAIKNKVKIEGCNKFMPLWYTLSCSKKSKGNALEMANQFYDTGLFLASEPDLMTDDQPTCVNDTHFDNQWALNNSGQNGGTNGIDIGFCQSREISLGHQNIVIAVIDHGFEMNHPDLANVHLQSFDTETGTSPAHVLGDHGTACAGIIGANSNNDLGVSGIAPECAIMSISNSLIGTPNSRQRRADGINFAWQNGASVISNSWGSGVQYQIIDDAIDDALSQGRNGLGCIVVFATGNDNGAINYPANSNQDIIAVGALSPCGERKNPTSCDNETWWGGNFGIQLDVSAPGVLMPTTDRQGALGYNDANGTNGDFTQSFNGTSAATPHVAAIAGLILSINPTLTQNQVRDIIESTCTKVGSYNYQTTTGRTNGIWHEEVGYGCVNAYEAVLAAQNIYSISGPSNLCSEGGSYSINLPSNATVTWNKSFDLEQVSPQGSNPCIFKPRMMIREFDELDRSKQVLSNPKLSISSYIEAVVTVAGNSITIRNN